MTNGCVKVDGEEEEGLDCHSSNLHPTEAQTELLDSYLVDPASSDMLVSKIKPCTC